ncbi:MAG TPA: hypothetical protein VMR21_02605 [Vicinamibacteria bacterium]|nr:hypothetical protein [Vicinamibacteria bacterium]
MSPLLLVLLAAVAAPAGPVLDVAGSVALTPEGDLAVAVELTNRGTVAAGAVTVLGELGGRYDEAKVTGGVPAGKAASAQLLFPHDVPRPGVYPLTLLLDYAPAPGTQGGPAVSQRAFLLLNLGAAAPAPVRISAPEITLRDRTPLPVTLESADGAAHRVRLRVLAPRGLNPESPSEEVSVPAAGRATVEVPLLRGGVPRRSRQGILLVAETLDGEVAQAAAATSVVSVASDPAVLPRLRVPLIVAAVALHVAAGVLEWLHVRRMRRAAARSAA